MTKSANLSITGTILAGGKARRMGGEDKGLLHYKNKPLISFAIEALTPQVDTLVINANRNLDHYQAFGLPVIEDSLANFCGPLAGMLSVMQAVETDYILTAPCDSPNISPQLRQRMMESLLIEQADIAVAHDGDRLQPVFCLIPCRLQDELSAYLQEGGRKIDIWLHKYKLAIVDFSDKPSTFINFNHPLRVAVIKHAHHNFDIDIPGKDSYEIRKAGAQQTLVSSSRLMALMEVQPSELNEPTLAELIPRLDCSKLDLILVEGFKQAAIPKIELYRPSLNKPLQYPDDSNIIAIASDEALANEHSLDKLDLNDSAAIADYIQHFITNWTAE